MNSNKLWGDLLTSKELRESHVTWVTSVPILVFQGLCVLELDTMYTTDRQMSDTHDCLMPPTLMAGHNNESSKRVITGIRSVFILVGKRAIFPTRPSCTHQYDTKVERKFLYGVVSPLPGTFRCSTCGRMCQSRIGLFSHNRTHRS